MERRAAYAGLAVMSLMGATDCDGSAAQSALVCHGHERQVSSAVGVCWCWCSWIKFRPLSVHSLSLRWSG